MAHANRNLAIRRQVAGKRLSRGCGDGPVIFSGLLPTNAIATAVGNHLNVVAKPVDVAVDGHPARIMCRMGKSLCFALCHCSTICRASAHILRRAVPPTVFQMAITNFWNAPAASGRPSPGPSPGTSRFAEMTAPGAAAETLPHGQIPFVAGGVAYYGLIDCIRSYLPSRSRSPVCNELGQLASAPESVPAQTLRIAKNRNMRIMRSPRLCKSTVPK
jgi:hypothetical protein